jgi:hypothetical protein
MRRCTLLLLVAAAASLPAQSSPTLESTAVLPPRVVNVEARVGETTLAGSIGLIDERHEVTAYVPVRALQRAIDGGEGVVKWKLDGSSLVAIGAGGCGPCTLTVQNPGIVSSRVRYVAVGGERQPYVPFEDVARALGMSVSSRGTSFAARFAIGAGGCGPCVLAPRRR